MWQESAMICKLYTMNQKSNERQHKMNGFVIPSCNALLTKSIHVRMCVRVLPLLILFGTRFGISPSLK